MTVGRSIAGRSVKVPSGILTVGRGSEAEPEPGGLPSRGSAGVRADRREARMRRWGEGVIVRIPLEMGRRRRSIDRLGFYLNVHDPKLRSFTIPSSLSERILSPFSTRQPSRDNSQPSLQENCNHLAIDSQIALG